MTIPSPSPRVFFPRDPNNPGYCYRGYAVQTASGNWHRLWAIDVYAAIEQLIAWNAWGDAITITEHTGALIINWLVDIDGKISRVK